jgi:hypothetical protein
MRTASLGSFVYSTIYRIGLQSRQSFSHPEESHRDMPARLSGFILSGLFSIELS